MGEIPACVTICMCYFRFALPFIPALPVPLPASCFPLPASRFSLPASRFSLLTSAPLRASGLALPAPCSSLASWPCPPRALPVSRFPPCSRTHFPPSRALPALPPRPLPALARAPSIKSSTSRYFLKQFSMYVCISLMTLMTTIQSDNRLGIIISDRCHKRSGHETYVCHELIINTCGVQDFVKFPSLLDQKKSWARIRTQGSQTRSNHKSLWHQSILILLQFSTKCSYGEPPM
jgi:hypothetical protein